jgi:hypothetical protein
MTTQINQNNIQPATLAALDSSPTVTNVQITDSSYVVIDDTAVLTTGGYIKITGSNLVSGCQVILGSANATSVTFVNSTTLNVQVPAQAAGTYVVYVVNPDGGVAIRVNGLTYSGNPTWVTGSTLPDQPANTAISIQLEATGDAPLTYIVQTGSTLPSGVALSSGGLITGSVAVGVQTLYNFTIEAIDAQSQESPRAFTVTITVGDTYWDYVTTLISANTPTTSVFVDDASTNNFPVTIFGDTRPNNFGPYTPGYYSNFFDGTGDYLSAPSNSALAFPGDFTMEAWVYFTTSGVACGFVSTYQPNTTYGTVLGMNSSNVLVFRLGVDAGGFQATDSVAIVPGVWYHVAGVRSGNTMTLYKNGVSVGSVGSVNITSDTTTAVLGRYYTNTDNFYLTGYISNARIVKGTAVYTANFTPPTVPLTAITNTSLLTCQSNRFIDNSTNNLTLTANGNTSINGFDPFLPNTSYSAYGSTYFDGTGDYLDIPSNAAFAFGTGNFTIECWMFNTDAGTTKRTAFKFSNPLMALTTNNSIASGIGFWDGSAVRQIVFTPNVWQHIAIVRISGVLTIYLNGVNQNSAALATSIAASNVSIGAENTQFPFLGYISDFRVTNTGVYTSNFTPPTAPVTAITGTQLLTCQTNQPVNNNVFIDNSTNNLLITRNGNATQGAFSPYGENWSIYAPATFNYLTGSNAIFNISSTSVVWTYESWIMPLTANHFFAIGSGGAYGNSITISWSTQTANKFRVTGGNGSNANPVGFQTTGTYPLGVWYHVAVTRTSAGVYTLYINGVADGTQTYNAATLAGGTTFVINGVYDNNGLGNAGGSVYISNTRFVIGTVVYTANFTPSTTPLLPIAGTNLLTCAAPNLVDESANRVAITRNGDVSVQKFGPFASTTLPTPYYSGYFDGSGDYLSFTGSPATTLTADLTVEAWVYLNSVSVAQPILCIGDSFSNPGILFYIANDAKMAIAYANARQLTGSGLLIVNTWNHVAFVRSGSTITAYLNGISQGTITNSNTFSGTTTLIGRELYNSSVGGQFSGYISNLRLVKGTAVYTANFTPPTAPLTAVANTSLLTCQNNTFIDNSTNNFTITAFGNTIPSTFAPFNVSYSTNQGYTPAVFGGSSYFDGTGDYIQAPTSSAFTFGTGAFTIEAWVNPSVNATQVTQWIYGNISTNSGNTQVGLGIVVNGTLQLQTWNAAIVTTSTVVPLNVWTHVAASFDGTTYRLFINGVLSATGTTLYTFSTNGPGTIGYNGSQGSNSLFTGYISDVRVIKGQALYTSNFVPQNTPLTAIRNTVLMVNGTSAGVYDSSMINDYETIGDAKIDTTVVKFTGTESIKFDGTGDYLLTSSSVINPNTAFGSSDFTIEFWVYLNTVASGQVLIDYRPSGLNGLYPLLWLGATGTITFYTNSADRISSGAIISTSTWYHVALSRSSGSTRLFVNGTQVGSTYADTNVYLSGINRPVIAASGSNLAQGNMNGNISDLRITNGIARYTTTFTPPTSPFQTS